MASYLRRPVSLTRNSRAVAENIFCTATPLSTVSRSRIPSRLSRALSRSYATVNPGDPKPDQNEPQKESKKSNSDKKAAQANDKEPGKPPPGFEETFNKDNQSSPLTGPSGGSSEGKEAKAAGYAALTEE